MTPVRLVPPQIGTCVPCGCDTASRTAPINESGRVGLRHLGKDLLHFDSGKSAQGLSSHISQRTQAQI